MSDTLDKVLDQELDPEEALIRAELDRLGLQGYELDDDAHISLETLKLLVQARVVGNPEEWMGENLNNTTGISRAQAHADLRKVIRDIEREDPGVAKGFIENMTRLANEGNPDNVSDRREYQLNERYLMDLAVYTIENMLLDGEVLNITPEQTLQWIALRGAKFFQRDFKLLARAGDVEIETKRIKLKGKQFAVGLGKAQGLDGLEIERIMQIILPDDCLSTGMSQEENIRHILELGFRPMRIIVAVTVATTAGFNKIKALEEEIKHIYLDEGVPYDFELAIVVPTVCQSVNGNMYLQTLDGKKLVGDMGEWNRELHEDNQEGAEQ